MVSERVALQVCGAESDLRGRPSDAGKSKVPRLIVHQHARDLLVHLDCFVCCKTAVN